MLVTNEWGSVWVRHILEVDRLGWAYVDNGLYSLRCSFFLYHESVNLLVLGFLRMHCFLHCYLNIVNEVFV